MYNSALNAKEKALQKIRLIFFPFVTIVTFFVFIYTFLHWQFFLIHPGNFKEEIIEIWLPLTLPFIAVLIWLRPRILLLDLKSKKGNLPVLLYMIAGFTISVTTIIAQAYIKTATGKLTTLQSINQIDKVELSKYYAIKTHYADKENICFKNTSEVSGKYNRYLTYHIYIACPIYNSTPVDSYISTRQTDSTGGVENVHIDSVVKDADKVYLKDTVDTIVKINPGIFNSSSVVPKAWLCFEYKTELSNKITQIEKHQKWQEFYTKTYKDFYKINIDSFIYLERLGNNTIREKYLEALSNCNVPVNLERTIILVARNESFENRNGNKLEWMFGVFCIGAVLFLIFILSKNIKEDKLNKFLKIS